MMRSFRGLDRKSLFADFVAGLTGALVYVPKGMALALVAGVNPVHGLYTGIVASFVGAVLAGSSFMVIVATNELAVPTGEILANFGGSSALSVLFTLTLMVGLIQLLFGVLRLGSIVRFISEAVMTGFVTGVAVLLVLGQVQKLTGFHGESSATTVIRAWEWLTHLGRIDVATTVVGLGTIAAIAALQRTPLAKFALVLAVVLASLFAAFWGRPSVALVGAIPLGLPSLALPDLQVIPNLIVPALSLAIVGLCVSAGIAQSYPERDGSIPDASRDFVGQGAANLAAGLLQGMPAGGSFSQTAVSAAAGATTRAATLWFGIVLSVVLLTIGGLVAYIPSAALAALMVVIGVEMLNPARIARVRGTHPSERVAMGLTFALTLAIPLQYAILAGVAFTLALYVYSSSTDIRIVEIAPLGDGRYEERAPPAHIPSNKTTILGLYGNAIFAAVYTLERRLPAVDETRNAALIVALRGHDSVTSTALAFIERFAKKLAAGGNRLMLSGVEPGVKRELERCGTIKVIGERNIFPTTSILGDSLRAAHAAATEWLNNIKDRRPS